MTECTLLSYFWLSKMWSISAKYIYLSFFDYKTNYIICLLCILTGLRSYRICIQPSIFPQNTSKSLRLPLFSERILLKELGMITSKDVFKICLHMIKTTSFTDVMPSYVLYTFSVKTMYISLRSSVIDRSREMFRDQPPQKYIVYLP